MDLQFKIGLGLTVIFGLLPFAIKDMPTLITWPGISIGLMLIIWALLPSGDRFSSGPIFLFIVSVAGMVASVAWFLQTPEIDFHQPSAQQETAANIEIHGPFQSAYKQFGAELGKATEIAQSSIGSGGNNMGSAFQGLYEKGWLIWFNALRYEILFLNIASGAFSTERHSVTPDQEEYWLLEKRCKKFKPPRGRLPLIGGTAWEWANGKGKTYWLNLTGWGIWHGQLVASQVFYQKFERGVIIGPLRRNYSLTEGDAQVFVLFGADHGDWKPYTANVAYAPDWYVHPDATRNPSHESSDDHPCPTAIQSR